MRYNLRCKREQDNPTAREEVSKHPAAYCRGLRQIAVVNRIFGERNFEESPYTTASLG